MAETQTYSNPVSAFFGWGGTPAPAPAPAVTLPTAPGSIPGLGSAAMVLPSALAINGSAATSLFVDVGAPALSGMFTGFSQTRDALQSGLASPDAPFKAPAVALGGSLADPGAAGTAAAGATSISVAPAADPMAAIAGMLMRSEVDRRLDAQAEADAANARAYSAANKITAQRGLGDKGFGFSSAARVSASELEDLAQAASEIEALSTQLGSAVTPASQARIRAEIEGKASAFTEYRSKLGDRTYRSFLKTYTNDGADLGVDWMLVAGLGGLVTPFLTLGLESYLAGEREDKMMKYNAQMRSEDRAHDMAMQELRGQQQLAAIGESNKKPGGSTASSASGNLGGAFASS